MREVHVEPLPALPVRQRTDLDEHGLSRAGQHVGRVLDVPQIKLEGLWRRQPHPTVVLESGSFDVALPRRVGVGRGGVDHSPFVHRPAHSQLPDQHCQPGTREEDHCEHPADKRELVNKSLWHPHRAVARAGRPPHEDALHAPLLALGRAVIRVEPLASLSLRAAEAPAPDEATKERVVACDKPAYSGAHALQDSAVRLFHYHAAGDAHCTVPRPCVDTVVAVVPLPQILRFSLGQESGVDAARAWRRRRRPHFAYCAAHGCVDRQCSDSGSATIASASAHSVPVRACVWLLFDRHPFFHFILLPERRRSLAIRHGLAA
mmetsp:Transcript_58023/g.160399  ORF Transcript_58023/g.160399 Transcript_58023/m.160399 type:complete len:319 (+) Transcript_58023:879-1835(+)